jgi:hypothetical protein
MRAATLKVRHWTKRGRPAPKETMRHYIRMLVRKDRRDKVAEELAEFRKGAVSPDAGLVTLTTTMNRHQRRKMHVTQREAVRLPFPSPFKARPGTSR